MQQSGLFGLSEHLERLSQHGDPLEVLEATVDFEAFRPWRLEGPGYGDGSRGGRPPFDPVAMFKALILQAQHNLDTRKNLTAVSGHAAWPRTLRNRNGNTTESNGRGLKAGLGGGRFLRVSTCLTPGWSS